MCLLHLLQKMNCAREIRTREEATRFLERTNFTQVTLPDQLVPRIQMLLHWKSDTLDHRDKKVLLGRWNSAMLNLANDLIQKPVVFPIFLSSDRNECEDGSAKCPANAVCSNTAGSYSCRCAEGYTLNEQGLCAGESERTECQQHSAFLRKMEKFFKESGTSNLHFRIHSLFCFCTFIFNWPCTLVAPSRLRLNHTERFSTIRKTKKFFFAQREDRVM